MSEFNIPGNTEVPALHDEFGLKDLDSPEVDFRGKDMDLYHTWKKTGDKKALGALVTQLNPLIFKEVKRQQGSLPPAALTAEAKKWAIRAIESFTPDKGASLGTHVTGWLRKIRRLNSTYQNAVRLPEDLHYKWNSYNNALTQLSSDLNREPTDAEMASHLGWKKAKVVKFKNSLYADYFESGSSKPSDYTQFDPSKLVYEYIMENLTPQEKMIVLSPATESNAELAAKLGVNINGLNYMKPKLRDKIARLKKEMGYF